MRLSAPQANIRIEPLDRDSRGDLNVSVSAAGHGFSGKHNYIWLNSSEVDRFLFEMQAISDFGHGRAILRGRDPAEFYLGLEIRSSQRLVLVTVHISRKLTIQGRECQPAVQFHFELNPSFLPQLLKEACQLASVYRRP